MKLKVLAVLFQVVLIGATAGADEPKPSTDPALEGVLQAIERLQENPAALKSAIEEATRKTEALRNAGNAATKEASEADGAKAELEKKLGGLQEQAEAARQKSAEAAKQLARIERAITVLKRLSPASDPSAAALEKKPLESGAKAEAKPAEPKPAQNKTIPAEAIQFFESKIRPILVENCYSCHGAQKQKGGLRLDSAEMLRKGSDNGPVVIAGKPDESSLIKAIRYDAETQMPPKGKLPQEAIDHLTEWVKLGAPWPESESAPNGEKKISTNIAEALDSPEKHWAFQPVHVPAVPEFPADHPELAEWAKTPIDHFILTALQKNGLKPNPPADRRTLIRRAAFDLTGLPPTMEEIANFEADPSKDAFEKVVDRLLTSPRYGERWGRYWLDIARYADTKGYVFQEERRYPYSFTYRDWVIRSFNEDLPYDQFIIQQLAADQLPLGEDKRPLAAMGFLTLGRRFLNNKNDIIDDRIDVVSRGLMALTVSCARCHDHKFDPIPTADYYSLYGVFASSVEPKDLPLIEKPREDDPQYVEFKAELEKREKNVSEYFSSRHADFLTRYREQAGAYMLAAHDGKKIEAEDAFQSMARDRKLQHLTVRRWQAYLDQRTKDFDPVFATWKEFSTIAADEFTTRSKEAAAQIAANADAAHKHNPLIAKAFEGEPPKTMQEVADRYGRVIAEADRLWAEMLQSYSQMAATEKASPAPLQALSDPNQEELRQVLYAPNAPGNISTQEVEQHMTLEEQAQLRNRRLAVDSLSATHPGRPRRAHVLNDADKPITPKIFTRGNPGTPGKEVPRQFLQAISGPDRKPFEKGSGRLEMAQAIASRENPLTARVFVNRAWMHHFGKGLVTTPSDFGTRSDPPTHPELLDYLAGRFIDEGWSVKKLHKMIMLSSVYQQTSEDHPEARAADPENRLVWKFNRERLDFEALRDSLLAAAGKLDTAMGGDPVEIAEPPYSNRRSVYGYIERQNLQGLFRTFDFASPDTTSPRRHETTVPQQALFMMNSPFVMNLARDFLKRGDQAASSSARDRIQSLYQLAYERDAAPDEVAIGLRFLLTEGLTSKETATQAWKNGWGEYDPESKTLKSFTPLAHWTGSAWQAGPKLPDPELGWVMLTSKGGHPGNLQRSVIRRWTAPRDGLISITGTLKHGSDKGDGVSGTLLHSRLGVLGNWTAQNGQTETNADRVEVLRGDTLDFIVDCRTNESHDSFEWSPRIRTTESRESATQLADAPLSWDASSDFIGPQSALLTPWEQYAQALLQSNEFAFVD